MRATTAYGKSKLALLQSLAHVSTNGVVVSIRQSLHQPPQADGRGWVFLPACLFDADMTHILPSTWRHELQHARDVLDGIADTMTVDELEKRARKAERQ